MSGSSAAAGRLQNRTTPADKAAIVLRILMVFFTIRSPFPCLLHRLRRRPALVDHFLVAGCVRSDVGHLLLRPGEVDAAVAVKVVVPDMLDFMRHGMGGCHIHGTVCENHPYRPRVPGVLAECPQHLGRVVRRQRLIVRVRAKREDMDLPVYRFFYADGVVRQC